MLTLITKIRKQILWIWIGFSIPVLLLIFVQTIAGKYAEIEATPWLWAGVNLLPGFILIMFGALRNKNSGKFVQTFIYRIIVVATIVYLIWVLVTMLSMTAGTATQSLEAYFQNSYRWLIPFQLLLLGVFALLFFREEAMFRPNEKMIKGQVTKDMEKAAAKNNLLQQQAFELLIANNYSSLFNDLHKKIGTKNAPKNTQLLMLQTQYNNWEKKTSLGLMDGKEAQLIINRITMALIQLIKTL